MILYTRLKIALTEDNPPVKTWCERPWSELPDATQMPVDGSLAILDAVHARLVLVLEALTPDQWSRTMQHPEWGVVSIDWLFNLCVWHGEHHTAHALELRKRSGW
ncbi:MAG TPA: DinB family protein [Gemmatimonadaceae bacterium]|nr:DinB family protein [Gemmatimonadaceae bacterium]